MRWRTCVLLASFYEFKTLDDFVEILAKRRSKSEPGFIMRVVVVYRSESDYARQVSDFST